MSKEQAPKLLRPIRKVQIMVDGLPMWKDGGQPADLFRKHAISLTFLIDGDGGMVVLVPASDGDKPFRIVERLSIEVERA